MASEQYEAFQEAADKVNYGPHEKEQSQCVVSFDADELQDVIFACETMRFACNNGSQMHNWMNTIRKMKAALK